MLWFFSYCLYIFYFFYFSLIQLLTVIYVNTLNHSVSGNGWRKEKSEDGTGTIIGTGSMCCNLGLWTQSGGIWTKCWRSYCPYITLVIATRSDKPDLVTRAGAAVFSHAREGQHRVYPGSKASLQAELTTEACWSPPARSPPVGIRGLTARGCVYWEKQAPTRVFLLLC